MPRNANMAEIRYVTCLNCPKFWRYGCPECAEDFAKYHREAFPGHYVTVDYDNQNVRQMFSEHRQRRRRQKEFWER